MKLSREGVIAYFLRTYTEEYDALGEEGVDAILDRGRQWPLVDVLLEEGTLVFPHVHIYDCGPQVAAVVHACLDSGSDTILALGVFHGATDAMVEAKARTDADPASIESEPLRRIYGPGLDHPLEAWKGDHSLYCFRRLLADEVKRRGMKPPTLIERYSFLTGPNPASLPGIAELEAIAKGAVVVSTADHCHHGIGYGDSRKEALYYDETGLAEIRRRVEENLALLDAGKLPEYLHHCQNVVKSDWRDAGPLTHALLGPLTSTVINVVPSDFSKSIYEAPAPTWAAGILVKATR